MGGQAEVMGMYEALPNAYPGRQLGVVTGRSVQLKVWGLAGQWHNARSETAHRLPSFRKLYREGRCVAVIDGFYEWRTEGAVKQPYYVSRTDGEPLLVAALCDATSCTLLTRDVVPDLAWLHHRMPVIFQDAQAARRWLDDDGNFDAPPTLKTHPVDRKMSTTSYQGDDASQPISNKNVGGYRLGRTTTSSPPSPHDKNTMTRQATDIPEPSPSKQHHSPPKQVVEVLDLTFDDDVPIVRTTKVTPKTKTTDVTKNNRAVTPSFKPVLDLTALAKEREAREERQGKKRRVVTPRTT